MADVADGSGVLSALPAILNYGGVGLLAIVCIAAIVYNGRNLNDLVSQGSVDKITAARPLLLANMAIALLVGAAALYLAIGDQKLKQPHDAQLLLDPWDDPLDAKYRPTIHIGDQDVKPVRLIKVPCGAGDSTSLQVNIEPYVRYRLDAGAKNRALLAPPVAP